MRPDLIREGRAVLFIGLTERDTEIRGKLILEHSWEGAALKVDYERTYRIGFLREKARKIFLQEKNFNEHFICYLDKQYKKVEMVEKVRLEVVVNRDLWQRASLSQCQNVPLFLMRRTGISTVRAAPIVSREEGRIVVGTPGEYPTTLSNETLNKTVESNGHSWFLADTAFGVIVDFHEQPKGVLQRVKLENLRPS